MYDWFFVISEQQVRFFKICCFIFIEKSMMFPVLL